MIFLYVVPILIFLLIILQGFFSNSEMAMVSSNKIKLNHLAKNGNKKAQIIINLLNKPEQLFATTLVGINLATVITTAIADFYFHDVFIKYYPEITNFISLELLTFFIMEPLILIFGELFPMSLARKYPNITSLRNATRINLAYITFFPLMLIVSRISKFIGFVFGSKLNEFGKITRDELQLIVTRKFSEITDKTRKIIEDIFDINEFTARDVMVHLNEVKAINEDATIGELKKLINETNFTRFPVYKDNIFNITATIHTLSILGVNDDNEKIINYVDKLYIVPESKPVVRILAELRRNRKHMAIVVDEYGAVSGIITIHNIVEEIIGDIRGETTNICSDKCDIFDAKTYLDDFYEMTGIDYRDEPVETIGGIINLSLGRIGRKGDKVIYKGIEYEVIDATDRSIKTIKILNRSINKKQENK